jgi:hypothetical protein
MSIPSSPGSERRRWQRHPVRLEVQGHLVPDPGGSLEPVRVVTISAGGLSMVIGRHIDPGQLVAVDLENPARRFGCRVTAEVLYATDLPGSGCVLGCAFTQPLSHQELQMLV